MGDPAARRTRPAAFAHRIFLPVSANLPEVRISCFVKLPLVLHNVSNASAADRSPLELAIEEGTKE